MLSKLNNMMIVAFFTYKSMGGGRGWYSYPHLSNVKQHLNVTWIMSYLQLVQLPGSLLLMEGILHQLRLVVYP